MGPRPHTTYQATRSLALWFWKRFLKGFYHIWAWRPSWSCDPDPQTNFRSPIPLRLQMKFGFDWPSSFGEEDLSKWWKDRQRMDVRPWLYYKLTNEPKGSDVLKKKYVYVTRLLFPSFILHSQIVLALASVPLCNRKTSARYIRTYLKQASTHSKSDISFIFIDCKWQTTFNLVQDKWQIQLCMNC